MTMAERKTAVVFRWVVLALVWLATTHGDRTFAQASPASVSVLPVFVVPRGQRAPGKEDTKLFAKHLAWAQKRYRQMLGNQTTFKLEEKVRTFRSKWTLAKFEKRGAAELLAEELFKDLKTNRFSCQYLFVAVFVVPEKKFPIKGRGRPFNGGINTGGGMVTLSWQAMKSENFQSTLQHELGHAFGMLHVDAYGHDMKRSESIMSYNESHHTRFLRPSRTPGVLIPENIRALALNDRVFDDLEFDPGKDAPKGYKLREIRHLGPLDLPPHTMIQVETSSGETYGSSVQNIVHFRIKRSVSRGRNNFDTKSMWHSARQADGVASVKLTFPETVELDRFKVHSQHSGKSHEVRGVRVSTIGMDSSVTEVASSEIDFPDGEIAFAKETSKRWKLEFKAGKSGAVVIRGLRFFSGDQELYPPLIPYHGEQ